MYMKTHIFSGKRKGISPTDAQRIRCDEPKISSMRLRLVNFCMTTAMPICTMFTMVVIASTNPISVEVAPRFSKYPVKKGPPSSWKIITAGKPSNTATRMPLR
ncbi:hypothetical protein D3C84_1145020 [compost metagenome]